MNNSNECFKENTKTIQMIQFKRIIQLNQFSFSKNDYSFSRTIFSRKNHLVEEIVHFLRRYSEKNKTKQKQRG